MKIKLIFEMSICLSYDDATTRIMLPQTVTAATLLLLLINFFISFSFFLSLFKYVFKNYMGPLAFM